jgi:hypothetical protein
LVRAEEMSEYFNSVKQFASSTFNNVSNAVSEQMKSPQQPMFMTVNRNQYQVLEKQGEVGCARPCFFLCLRDGLREASRLFTRCRTRADRCTR